MTLAKRLMMDCEKPGCIVSELSRDEWPCNIFDKGHPRHARIGGVPLEKFMADYSSITVRLRSHALRTLGIMPPF
jgi:hypothetical protein